MFVNAKLEDTTTGILKVPPEIFHLIASNLPLRLLPATLSALALTCSGIHSYVRPILYSKVIIKNEDHASQVLERISVDPQLGLLILEFHLLLDLIDEVRKRKKTTVLVKLQEVIERGYLPHLNFFRLVLLKSRYAEKDVELHFNGQYHLPRSFWATLRRCCPLLRGLCVDGVGDTSGDPWVNDPHFYDLEDFVGLRTFSVRSRYWVPQEDCVERLCRNITNLASSLQSLTLLFHLYKLYDATLLFSVTLPHLKSFCISGFDLRYTGKNSRNTEMTMTSFWGRHPNLERISINAHNLTRWFPDVVEDGFLPKLKHLRAQYQDVRGLAAHLGQLEHLCITYSHNCQVPYLLRSVLSDGLPKLKSLEVHQAPCKDDYIPLIEGAMWYETENGQFLEETTLDKADKRVDSSYVRSIVRGAPNIKELCLYDFSLYLKDFKQVCTMLGQLQFLERFYCQAFCDVPDSMYDDLDAADLADYMDSFVSKCRQLGNSCPFLTTVTELTFHESGLYRTGNIIRGCGGSVEEVVPGRGFGTEARGSDDDPFPDNYPFAW